MENPFVSIPNEANAYVSVADFFEKGRGRACALVCDTSNIRQFIAAHILHRSRANVLEIETVESSDVENVKTWLRLNPGSAIILLNPHYSMQEIHELAMMSTNVLLFVTHHSLYQKILRYGNKSGMNGKTTLIVSMESYLEELVYSSCHPESETYPMYVQSFCDTQVLPTISTPEQQLLFKMQRNHRAWFNSYPEEDTIAMDAYELGYRVIDNSERLSRMIFRSAHQVQDKEKVGIYVNGCMEDFTGLLHLMDSRHSKTTNKKKIDYWCVYDIHRDNIRYRIKRAHNDFDLLEAFERHAPVGNHSLINITRLIDPRKTEIILPSRRWF